ncbi:MAG: alpha/beta fold hydrolase [Streptosporangiaceae bacterium]|jgi:triacylglycerol esterase/lipase EstA (alpha/beta hydrolase family)
MRLRVPLSCRLVVAAFAVPVLFAVQGPAAAAAQARIPLPVPYNAVGGVAQALAAPDSSPPGANNWSCKPSSAHPDPVVLVPGTFADMADNFNSVSPLLYDHGYCVFALNYGGTPGSPIQSIGEISASAAQLEAFVNRVLAATRAARVDLVGHSQGGMMPRYYLKFLGGAAKVSRFVALAPSSHGTSLDGLITLVSDFGLLGLSNSLVSAACEACVEQEAGSAFLANLNAGGDTAPGVSYTVIETRYDEVVTPYTSAFLTGSDVTNITLQKQCPLDLTDHIGIAFDPVALTDMLNALDPGHHLPVPCLLVPPAL